MQKSCSGRNAARGLLMAALAALAAVLAYVLAIRPNLIRWGVGDDEAEMTLPGDDLIPDPITQSTRGITISAPADEVWPWLVQIGQGRGGFYSYDQLENSLGLDIHSADEILPEHQSLDVGDLIALAPDGEVSLVVARSEPPHALVLRGMDPKTGEAVDPSAGNHMDFTWSFVLRQVNSTTTRLLVRGRGSGEPRGPMHVPLLALEPITFVMERKMMQGIKERAERS